MSDRQAELTPVGPQLRALGAPALASSGWRGAAAARRALASAVLRQLERGRGFLWLPVLYGCGIAGYFALPAEPSLPPLASVTLALALAAVLARPPPLLYAALLAGAAIAAGTTGAKLRTDWVRAPVLAAERTLTVTGWVAERERSNTGGARLTVLVQSAGDLTPEQTPHFIRVTARSGADAIGYGDGISVLARLAPPRGPAFPGGYDFAVADYYRRVGATGFALGAPKAADLGPPPFSIALMASIERLRSAIASALRRALPGEDGAIAEALIVGEQGGISEATQARYRASGLAHILSISGLHMALVAGAVFSALRALLALVPALALTRPIKKWAAAAALIVATLYVGISGAAVATVRSYVMLAIMLLAVMLDRRAASLRNVALAALVLLVFEPEAILTASFQMSFAATLAIVAGYEAFADRQSRRIKTGAPAAGRRILRALGGLALTSLLAGLATAPFVAFHFQRLAPLSLLANIAAGPPVSLVVMPMALAAVLLMPFGLEALPLWLMARGLDAVDAINDWTAARSIGIGEVPMMPQAAFLLAIAGLVWLCLWQGRARLLGVASAILAVAIAALGQRPEVIVNAEGTAVAVRGAEGSYRVLGGKGAAFAIGQWLRADGDLREARDPTLDDDTDCDNLGCTALISSIGRRVALSLDRRAFAEDCRLAAVVVSPLAAPDRCRTTALVIDRTALAAFGSHAIWTVADQSRQPTLRIETAYPAVRRPFMPAITKTSPPSAAAQ
ncbi:MAG: ComEC/Rec2 family competence protein [Bauldia sp.]